MGGRHRLVVVLVTVVLGLAVGVDARAAASAPPEPVLVVPGAASDGQLTVRPATQLADDRGRLTWTVANGGTGALTLTLALHEVSSRAGRVEVGQRHGRLALRDHRVVLAPGEVARVRVPVPDGLGPQTVALVAQADDGGARVTGLALIGGGGTVRPEVTETDARAGTVTVRLHAPGPALVDVAVRAVVWPGLVHDEQVVTDVLVPVGGRDVPMAVGGPVAGRVTIEVTVSGDGARTTRTVWWWPRWVPISVAAVLVVVTALLVVGARRGRVGGAPGAPG